MEDHKSRIERVQQKLDSQNFHPIHEEFVLHEKEYNLKPDWQENPGPDYKPGIIEKIGLFRIFLGAAFVFFLGSLAYAGFIFTRDNQPTRGDDVTITVVGPVSVGGGEKLSVDVLIQNNNVVPVELADLVVDFPEGTKSSDDLATDIRHTREDLGTIESGAVIRRTINAALFGEENSTKTITVGTDYRVQGSTAIFEKRKSFDIVLNASPIRLTVEALREISAGQALELKVKIVSNSSKRLENVMLTASYPFGFMFQDSNIKPSFDKNVWLFAGLNPKEEQTIVIRGIIEGQNSEDRFFRFNSGIAKENSASELGVIFNSTTHLTTIQKSFIDLALVVNGTEGENLYMTSEDGANGELVFSNNTNDMIRDVRIDMEILGSAIDKKSVTVEKGFYNSGTNMISWSSETDSEFQVMNPRDTLRVQFRFNSLNFSSGAYNTRNPEIKLRAGVTGKRVSGNNVQEEIETIASANIRIQSDVPILAYTAHADGVFTNSGPIPPRVEQETTYTIAYQVSNNSNELRNAKIEGVLPSYVSWNNLVQPESEIVTFDYQTRKFTWNIGTITPGAGFGQKAETLSFKVTLLPSASQIGSAPDLVRNSVFTATDLFTNTTITKAVPPITTKIYNQPIGNNHQNVVE